MFDPPLSPRIANYKIKVTLDDETKRIDALAVITWNNPSNDPISELQFHLYHNGFKNAKSTWIRDYIRREARNKTDKSPVEVPWKKDDGWGWTRVTSMEVDGVNLTDRIAFIHPDDNNADDQTVLSVALDKPIAAKATARIEMVFESRIPQCHRRWGWWADDFFMMSHWFPQIGVYETPGQRFVPPNAPRGRWNCHQFHCATEFYADFGVYDVEITLPAKYVVGTSGIIVDERGNGDGTKTVVAHAEDVHEFAWVADAQFREATRTWTHPVTNRSVIIRLLYQPDHEGLVEKYLNSTVGALEYAHEWLGDNAYPYPVITVVDPRRGSGAGGMEYPNLITGGGSWLVEKIAGDGLRMTELVTIHEFMHQIWYGIVANNEFEEAWLDEGLTTYSENRITSQIYGNAIDFWGATATSVGLQRGGYALSKASNDGTLADVTYAHWSPGVGLNLAYNKTSLLLHTLENYVGRERFDQIMRTYYQRWRFKHPNRDDFVAVANEVNGESLDWFFDQLINQPTSLDYGVARISNVPVRSFDAGVDGYEYRPLKPEDTSDEEDEEAADDGDEEDDTIYESTVVFRRIGDVVFPMDVLIEFSDGEVVTETWDGRDRTKQYTFTRPAKVIRAAIDPEGKVPLDVNRLNNSKRLESVSIATNKYTAKGFFWMQSLLQLLGIIG